MTRPWSKPSVYLHADSYIDDCDCGDWEYEVQPGDTWMWAAFGGPDVASFQSLDAAMTYAATLHPDHPDVKMFE